MTGVLIGPASPAHAEKPGVTITSLSNANLQAGESATLKYKVENKNPLVPPGAESSANIQVTLTINGVTCQGQCTFIDTIAPGASKDFTATLRAGNIPTGETRSGKVQIKASFGPDSETTEADLTATGPEQPQVLTVTEVSGIVKDVFSGTPLENATVSMQDSANPPHTWDTSTNRSGQFKFVPTADKPIAPGILAIIVSKDGYKEYSKTPTGVAGQALRNIALTMASTTSPSATPTAGDTGAPSEQTPFNEPSIGGLSPNEEEGSGLSFVLIAMGGLLFLLGIGAIVLLFMRRRHDEEDDDPDQVGPPRGPQRGGRVPAPRGGGPRPPQRRGPPPDPTAPVRRPDMAEPTAMMRRPDAGPHPVGPRAGDPTMIARSPLADAPTMLHGRVQADQPDPYSSPVRPGGPQPPYGGPPGYGSPTSPPGGYGPPPTAPINGYGPGGGYDSGYGGQSGQGGWDQQRGGYDPGYPPPAQGGYGPSSPASGYGPSSPAGGYGPPASPPSGYGPPQPSGYEPGYGSQGGWDQQQRPAPSSYDPAYEEYDRPTRPRQGNDRRLDWMDD